MFRLLRQLILVGGIFLVGYLFGLKQVRFYQITSSSMEPLLQRNDRIAAVKPERIERGTIVVLRDPKGGEEILTKRVIGLPGEKLSVREGYVYINNERLDEPYIKEPTAYQIEPFTIPESCYFLLGDNRNNSEDSSIWGPVEKELIVGRAFCRYWPLKKFGFFLQQK